MDVRDGIQTREYLFASVFLLSNRLQMLGDCYLKEISLKQWFLLVMIHTMEKEQCSVTEVATFIGSTRQNVRKMLEILSGKGYVRLTKNPHDRRNLSVELTEKTYRFFAGFEARGELFLQELFKGISEEQLKFSREMVDGLFENLEGMEKKYGKDCSDL